MDEAKILELAKQAGPLGIYPVPEGSSEHGITRAELIAFARLVAEAERERAARIVLDDMMAISYQSMGQYRTGLAYHIMGIEQPAKAGAD